MADLLGVSQPVYSRLERNETSIDLEQLLQFSRILQIPVQEFLPDILSVNSENQNTHNGQGVVLGNVYFYADKDASQELEIKTQELKACQEKITLLQKRISDLEELNAVLKKQK